VILQLTISGCWRISWVQNWKSQPFNPTNNHWYVFPYFQFNFTPFFSLSPTTYQEFHIPIHQLVRLLFDYNFFLIMFNHSYVSLICEKFFQDLKHDVQVLKPDVTDLPFRDVMIVFVLLASWRLGEYCADRENQIRQVQRVILAVLVWSSWNSD